MNKSKLKFLLPLCLSFLLMLTPWFAACTPTDPTGELDEWKVILDFNDGVSRDGMLFVEKTKSVRLPDDIVRDGYNFAGWEDESGAAVSLTYTPAADVKLIARWEEGRCDIVFDLNYPGAQPISQSVEYGDAITPPAPERDGYRLRWWSANPDGEAVDFDNYLANGDYTFYAIWIDTSIREYVVTFKPGAYDGAPASSKQYVLEGGAIRSGSVPKAERKGYKLAGWTTEAPQGEDWTINTYPAQNTPALVRFPYVPTSDQTLHAVWTIQKYTAVFNVNYTDSPYQYGVYESFDLLSNAAVEPPVSDPVRKDYTFTGWYTAALGGDKVDFSQNVTLNANTGYYAHWRHNGVRTDTFQAEYVEFDPTQSYYGYSGSVLGARCIVKDAGTVGSVMKDDYALNSKVTAHNGYYVSYQYEYGNTLRFEIIASKATTATLIGNLAVEGDAKTIGSVGENSTLLKVNGESVTYSINLIPVFAEYNIATVQLKEGKNVIEFIVNNRNTVMGGTYRAVGFMTDYIRLAGSDATFTWSPVYDNLEVIF